MEYDPTQFRGTAPYYLRGRPPYSADLGRVLTAELGLDGRGRLLDVGSGPGTVGVQLAPLFDHVTFAEPDADLLDRARIHASRSGLTSANFVRSTAEHLDDAGLPPMRVVAFGQSFHRTDRVRATAVVHDLLEPGGSLVLISHDPSRPAPSQPDGTVPIPHDEIRRLVQRFLGLQMRSGARLASSYGSERFERTLSRSRFGTPRIVHARGRADLVRDADEVIANYLSMSYAAPPLFGARLPEFVAELRVLLADRAPDGEFWDWPGDTELVIATRD